MEARPRIFSRQRSIGGLFPGTVLPAMGRERILIEQVFNGEHQGEVYIARDLGTRSRNYSESTAELIDSEVRFLVDSAYERAMAILTENRDKLDILTEALMEFETLEGSQVMDILEYGEMKNPPARVTPPPMPSEVEEQPGKDDSGHTEKKEAEETRADGAEERKMEGELEQAEREGAWIINKPQSLRDCNEKLFATLFPQCTPPTIVSRRPDVLREFADHHGDVILKPLDGMGGASIFRVKESDPNIGVIAETLTELGTRYCMAQNYIPAIKDGDKRVLVVDGEPVPYCLARIPQGGETRGNLAAGGRGEPRPLTESDWEIARRVGPTLKAKGLIFVGLDIIGDRLTEVNVTSPTCIREIEAEFPISITGMLMDAIEKRLQK